MPEYRASLLIELVDDVPTFAELVIESTDRVFRSAAWPVDAPAVASLESAARQSVDALAARAATLGEEILRARGIEQRSRWSVTRELVLADGGGTCGSVELSAIVSRRV